MRREYTDFFKAQRCKQVGSGRPVKNVAAEYNIAQGMLRTWCRDRNTQLPGRTPKYDPILVAKIVDLIERKETIVSMAAIEYDVGEGAIRRACANIGVACRGGGYGNRMVDFREGGLVI